MTVWIQQTNTWDLDEINLGDTYETVVKDFKKTVAAEKTLGLHEMSLFSLVASLNKDNRQLGIFSKTLPGIKKRQRKMNFSFLVHRWVRQAPQADVW